MRTQTRAKKKRPPRRRGECRQCGAAAALFPRDLCPNCYSDPAIRASHAPRRPRWTAGQDAELLRLTDEGFTLAEIASRLGQSRSATQQRRYRLGRPRFRTLSADQRRRAAEALRRDPGLTGAAVARLVGCEESSGRRLRLQLGYSGLSASEAAREREKSQKAKWLASLNATERKILALLDAGPLLTPRVAERLGMSRVGAWGALAGLREKGKAFAEGLSRKGGPRGVTWHSLNWWLAEHDALVWHMTHKLGKKYGVAQDEREDLASVFRLGVAKCVKTFLPTGVKFASYAVLAAWRDAADWALGERSRGVHVPHALRPKLSVPVSSLDAIRVSEDDRAFEPEARDGSGAPPMDPEFWSRVEAFLPPTLAALVVGHFRDGKTYPELAGEFLGGSSGEWVRHQILKARNLLRSPGSPLAEYGDCEREECA